METRARQEGQREKLIGLVQQRTAVATRAGASLEVGWVDRIVRRAVLEEPAATLLRGGTAQWQPRGRSTESKDLEGE